MIQLEINREQLPSYLKQKYFYNKGEINILEIGVYEGAYSMIICDAFADGKIYGIDMWETAGNDFYYSKFPGLVEKSYEIAKGKLSNISNYKMIKGKSENICKDFEDNFFDFIYIDSDHSYKGVTICLNDWYPKLKLGGIMSGHDYDCNPYNEYRSEFGVKEALESFFKDEFNSISITNEEYHKSWIIQKNK